MDQCPELVLHLEIQVVRLRNRATNRQATGLFRVIPMLPIISYKSWQRCLVAAGPGLSRYKIYAR